MQKYSPKLSYAILESTVHGMKAKYLGMLKRGMDPLDVKQLPHGLRGRPLKLGDDDAMVKQYIHSLRLASGIVSGSCE